MPIVTDTFPAPALNADRWSSVLIGTVGMNVGVPTDGVYPTGVDDHGDEVRVHSDSKMTTPAGQPFSFEISYAEIYIDPVQNIIPYVGWRSMDKDGLGNPRYGIDIMLQAEPSSVFTLQKRIISLGAITVSNIIPDPNNGVDSRFRVRRNGNVYYLDVWIIDDLTWENVVAQTLPTQGEGFVVFGIMAINPTIPFPWVAQT